jgi:hypothetical protein
VRVWDVADRKNVNEFDVVGASAHNSLDWVDNETLLADGKYVIDVPHRVVTWVYESVSMGRLFGNRVWYVEGGDKPILASGTVPPEDSKELVAGIDPDSMLVIKPGQVVSVDVQLGSYPQHRDKILKDITRQLEANEMKVADGGRFKVLISVKPATPQQVSYRRFGSRQTETHQINVQQITVEYMKDGNVIWASGGMSGASHILHLQQGESIDQAIQRQIEQGVAGAGNIALPKHLSLLPDGKSPGKSKVPESD